MPEPLDYVFDVIWSVVAKFQGRPPSRTRPDLDSSGPGHELSIRTLVEIGEKSPFLQTHPDQLAAVATLFGMRPQPPDRCRVLELGCAGGGNLIPMALALPESRFLGIDLSRRQISTGQALVRKLGLRNIGLQPLSVLDLDSRFGRFDYIICHGIYS